MSETENRLPFPFDLDTFLDNWWAHLADKFQPLERYQNLVIHSKTVMFGLSMRKIRLAGWNAAWAQELGLSDVAVLKQIHQSCQWDYFRVCRRDNQANELAWQAVRDLGFRPFSLPESPAYLIDLDEGWDGYLASLSKGKRRDIRRNLKALTPLNPQLKRFKGDAEIAYFFELFFRHHQSYWGTKPGGSYFTDAREQTFILSWAKALEKQGMLLLEGFYLNETLCNLTMNILVGHTLYSLITINTGEFTQYAPGLTSLYYRIQQADEHQIACIDLGAEDYGYKRSLSNRFEPQSTLIFANPLSLRGVMYTRWLESRHRPAFAQRA